MPRMQRRSAPGDHKAAAALIRDSCVGKVVRSFSIHAANSLKTIGGADLLAGMAVRGARSEAAAFDVIFDRAELHVDLQRVGAVALLEDIGEWSPGASGPRPTARMIFTDGTGVDFTESSRTKRIGLWLNLTHDQDGQN